jgi:hypothetical protein
MQLLCVCEEEWCYCTNLVDADVDLESGRVPDIACPECADGHHVDEGGRRG